MPSGPPTLPVQIHINGPTDDNVEILVDGKPFPCTSLQIEVRGGGNFNTVRFETSAAILRMPVDQQNSAECKGFVECEVNGKTYFLVDPIRYDIVPRSTGSRNWLENLFSVGKPFKGGLVRPNNPAVLIHDEVFVPSGGCGLDEASQSARPRTAVVSTPSGESFRVLRHQLEAMGKGVATLNSAVLPAFRGMGKTMAMMDSLIRKLDWPEEPEETQGDFESFQFLEPEKFESEFEFERWSEHESD